MLNKIPGSIMADVTLIIFTKFFIMCITTTNILSFTPNNLKWKKRVIEEGIVKKLLE